MAGSELTDEAQSPPPWRRSPTSAVLALSLLMLVGAFAVDRLFFDGSAVIADAPFVLPWLVIVAAFAASELLGVHLESRGDAHSITFPEIPYVLALSLATPHSVVVGRLLAGIVVLGVIQRQSPRKLFFNLSMFALEATAVAAVFHSVLGGGNPIEPRSWVAAFAALLTGHLIGAVFVTAAITVSSGWPGHSLVRRVMTVGVVACIANVATGLAALTLLWGDERAVLLLIGVATVLITLYRAYMGLQERHRGLEALHDFTRSVGGPLDLQDVEVAVLEGACMMMRAGHSSLLLPPWLAEGRPRRIELTDGEPGKTELSPEELQAEIEQLLPSGEARLINPADGLPAWLEAIGPKDVLAAPVTVDGSPSGIFVVAGRLATISTFDSEDLQVFQTLANHASVALDNGRLFARIQHEADERAHQALHDSSTGLPNRILLKERLTEAIDTARRTSAPVGVVVLDLDTFKEVNDTLGPSTGDRLLLEVRERVAGMLPSAAMLARFAGDQFAVLLPSMAEASQAAELAERLASAFDTPFTSEGVSLALGASIGVACYPEHASSAEILLQRADAATYVARLERSGVEIYSTDRDPYAPRRLALAAELKEAIDLGQVEVFVQPKVSVEDGVVRGAEALVRWKHPRLGNMSPAQFIPAAEHTGVIRPLTLYVVRNALEQCRAWRAAGHDLTVAANLSARNLLDQHLVEDIGTIIEELNLPPGVLTLELTESTVMSESKRSMEILNGLHDLGVRLSVDDFGTGYSSLAHLRRLPVSELKIDRSFVSSMTVNEHDAVIVRSLVELSKNLGLRTVAEGVENREAWDRLKEFGCEQAQGFLISRALPAEQFVTWLGTQEVGRLASAEQPVIRLDQVRRK